MKQVYLKIFLLALFTIFGMRVSAYDAYVDGIYYNLEKGDKTASVTRSEEYYSGDIIIPESIIYEGITYSVTSIGNGAFRGCSGLTSIVIPNSVTYIDSYEFEGCNSLPIMNNCRYADTYLVEVVDKTIVTCSIKEGTRFIRSGAFYGCSGLTSITIPNSVTSIGRGAFSGCNSLPIMNNCRYADTYLVEVVDKTIVTCSVKERTRIIGCSAFDGCSDLTSITIPNSVMSIDDGAFIFCI